MSLVDAWAAGLFEGEGCISIQKAWKGKKRVSFTPVLVLKMTDRDVVYRFQEVMGFGSIYEHAYDNPKLKTSWDWRVTGWRALREFRDRIGPWLGERRLARLTEVLALEPPPRVYSPDCEEPSEACYDRHRRNGEPPCRAGMDAKNIAQNARKQRRVA